MKLQQFMYQDSNQNQNEIDQFDFGIKPQSALAQLKRSIIKKEATKNIIERSQQISYLFNKKQREQLFERKTEQVKINGFETNPHEQLQLNKDEKQIKQNSTTVGSSLGHKEFLQEKESQQQKEEKKNSSEIEEQKPPQKIQSYEELIQLSQLQEVRQKLFRVCIILLFNEGDADIERVEKMVKKEYSQLPIVRCYQYQEAKKFIEQKKTDEIFITVLISTKIPSFKISAQKIYCENLIKQIIIYGSFKQEPDFVHSYHFEKKQQAKCSTFSDLEYYFSKERNATLNRPPLPNFSGLSIEGNYRQRAFNSIFNFYGFKASMQNKKEIENVRKIAKNDFIKLAGACKVNFSPAKFQKDLEEFSSTYPETQEYEKSLKWYTRQTFFFKIVNIGLRVLRNPKDTYYFRLVCYDLYHAIKGKYKKEEIGEAFRCYRGAYIDNEEIKYLKENIEKYIQFEGFLSTSKSEETAQNYANNCIIQIYVQPAKKGKQSGYANITQFSHYEDEEEILFNVLNIFKIKSIKKIYIGTKEIQYVRLQYISNISEEISKNKFQEGIACLKAYKSFCREMKEKIYCQGDVMYIIRKWNEAMHYFLQLEKKLENNSNVEVWEKIKVYDRLAEMNLFQNIKKSRQYLEKIRKSLEKVKDFQKINLQTFIHFSIMLLKKNPNSESSDLEEKFDEEINMYKRSTFFLFDEDELVLGEQSETKNTIQCNLASLYVLKMNFQKGLKNLQDHLNLFEKKIDWEHFQKAVFYNNISLCYQEVATTFWNSKKIKLQKLLEEGELHYKKSLDIMEKFNLTGSVRNVILYNYECFKIEKLFCEFKNINEKIKEIENANGKNEEKSQEQKQKLIKNLKKSENKKKKEIIKNLKEGKEQLEKIKKSTENELLLSYIQRKECIFSILLKSSQQNSKQNQQNQQNPIEYFQKVKKIIEKKEKPEQKKIIKNIKGSITFHGAILKNNEGLVNFYEDKQEQALELFYQGLAICEKLPIKEEDQVKILKASLLNNIGSVYSRKFNYGEAEKKYEQTHEILKEIKTNCEKLKASFYNNRALLRYRKEEYDKAQKQVEIDFKDYDEFYKKIVKRYTGKQS